MVILTAYRYLREVDKPICVASCLQDPDCTAVTYSIYKPPIASSLCKFYRSRVAENDTTYNKLTLKKQDGSNKIISNLTLFISKLQDVYLYHAKLEGSYYSNIRKDYGGCNETCSEDLFCDAFSFLNGNCSMYSTKNVRNIAFEKFSEVAFKGLHAIKQN